MLITFNMGIGMILVVSQMDLPAVLDLTNKENVHVIGKIDGISSLILCNNLSWILYSPLLL